MIQAYRITSAQAEELVGQQWEIDDYFNPVQDINDNWFISQQCVDGYQGSSYPWFSTLVLEDF